MNTIPMTEEIECAVKIIAKESTAPDKETPDWMETDIRRGMMWMLGRILKPAISIPPPREVEK